MQEVVFIWIVTCHFSRGNSEIHIFNTATEAKAYVDVVLWNNEDTTNVSIFKTPDPSFKEPE